MTELASPAADPLDPWPQTAQWLPVSSRQIIVEHLRLLTTIAIAELVCFATWWTFENRSALYAAAIIGVFGLARAMLIFRSVRSWGYAERSDDLLVRHGLMVRRLSIVPYARMQFVDVSVSPLERMFGLATIELHTAAAASDARIPGLPGSEAARLRDRLSALGKTDAEGL